MKIKIFLFFLILSTVFVPAQGKFNGYFSLNYIKGQKQTAFHQGSFQNAVLGLIFSGDTTENVGYTAEIRFADDNFKLEELFVHSTLSLASISSLLEDTIN